MESKTQNSTPHFCSWPQSILTNKIFQQFEHIPYFTFVWPRVKKTELGKNEYFWQLPQFLAAKKIAMAKSIFANTKQICNKKYFRF